ncbi:hypothetical protein ACHAPT_004044 [Fusarium lateritium]
MTDTVLRSSRDGRHNDEPSGEHPAEEHPEESPSETILSDSCPRSVTQRPPLGILIPPGDLPAITEEPEPRPEEIQLSREQAKPNPRSPKLRFPQVGLGYEGCAFCGKQYIKVASVAYQDDDALEIRAYLPCGHVFGHRCLNRYMQGLKHDGTQPKCCPWGDCIPLEHYCGHLCIPQRTVPEHLCTNKSSPVLDDLCEFCASAEGRSLRQRIEKYEQKRLHHLESSMSCSPLVRSLHKSHMRIFEMLLRKKVEELEKIHLAYEESRGRNFYRQWLMESRRSQEHRARNSSGSRDQGDETKSQLYRHNQLPDNERQDSQSRGARVRDSQTRDSQVPDNRRRTSVTSNNLPQDSQLGNNQGGLTSEGQQSTPRRVSVTLPDLVALERRAETRAVKKAERARREMGLVDEMDLVEEMDEDEDGDEVENRDKGKGKERAVEETYAPEERGEVQKRDRGKGKAVEEIYEAEERDEVQKRDKGKGRAVDEVEEGGKVQKQDKGKGRAVDEVDEVQKGREVQKEVKPVELYDKPMPEEGW